MEGDGLAGHAGIYGLASGDLEGVEEANEDL